VGPIAIDQWRDFKLQAALGNLLRPAAIRAIPSFS
jgi:hypothetical protein